MFRFFGKSGLRRQAATVGLLSITEIIAFQFVFKARMRHEDGSTSHHNEAILLLFTTGRTIT